MEKCLAFCQDLVISNHKFSFNFNENKEQVNSSWKKKKSPSQVRREAKRRETRKTTQEATEKVSAKSLSDNLDYKCPQCEISFKTEKGLNIHIGKAHKKEELPTPEKERGASAHEDLSLTLTPPKECREEFKRIHWRK